MNWRKNRQQQRPKKTKQECPNCGKELTEHELFFGLCKCKYPIHPQSKQQPEKGKDKSSEQG